MAKLNKFRSYPKGSDSRKGDTKKVGVSFSRSRIKEENKPKWRLSDTGAVRTKISFPKSNKATVGKSGKLFRKKSSISTQGGRAKRVLI